MDLTKAIELVTQDTRQHNRARRWNQRDAVRFVRRALTADEFMAIEPGAIFTAYHAVWNASDADIAAALR